MSGTDADATTEPEVAGVDHNREGLDVVNVGGAAAVDIAGCTGVGLPVAVQVGEIHPLAYFGRAPVTAARSPYAPLAGSD